MPDAAPGGMAGAVAVPGVARVQRAPGRGPDAGAEEIAGLRAAFPGWHVWRSDEGGWWASRRRPLRPSKWPPGYALTLTAVEARGLHELITRQPANPR